ncbi:hypothetical protein JHN59_40040, partial [Streptomyces sp. MBT49]|uniref:hypothetical protein n=1 Tax=Streptomyces sp. MBT97 TaxID=2800411 RepID=UPI00190E5245|nr:hypothetical protein [Streptomyces sp. MBT97]MBK3630878.1 hypothetical protein [Streptomyces sp. MBT49]MBK3638173.1 hypothetical protein [Streptomyces sp. MBT97]
MDIREEFRAAWDESAARGGFRDELHQLGAWLLGLPGALLRTLTRYSRALVRIVLGLLVDACRGTPVLIGLLVRGLIRAIRAGFRASASPGEAAAAPVGQPKAKQTAPAAEGGADREPGDEEAQLAADAPAGPPWKRRTKPSPAPAKQAPAEPLAPAGLGPGDFVERAVVSFLVLALGATFLGTAGGFLGDLLAPYASGIVLALVAGWCFAAVMVAPRPGEALEKEEPREGDEDDEDPTENDHENRAGEDPQEDDPWPAQREAIRAFVEKEVAAGAAGHREAKGKGARVDDLLAELQRRGSAQEWDRNAMLDLLERAGITVRQQMKFRVGGRQKTPPGVHIDDLASDLGFRPRLPAHLVPDITAQSGPSRELNSHPG